MKKKVLSLMQKTHSINCHPSLKVIDTTEDQIHRLPLLKPSVTENTKARLFITAKLKIRRKTLSIL